jgi:Protein of unknown function (DUF3365)
MRLISFSLIFLMISSCGMKQEKEAQKEASTKQVYLQKGGEIVDVTQSELLKNVSQAMKTGGPGYAVEFCNIRAMVIKDSLSSLNNCQIRRIALKYRNPLDMPQSNTEKDQLNKYQLAYQKGEAIEAEVHLFENRVEYYQPIIIKNGTCLLCHGHPGKQIAEKTMEKIKARYPDDLATGFAMNDFRGAWKITFNK